jgi:DNA-binding response OmpR family regulator
MVELGGQKRVLIVDDERLITDTLVTILSQSGYETKGVYSAEQSLSAMEDWQPELAIIDVLLPAMNGIDLAIRIESEWAKCPHLFVFGAGGHGSHGHSIKAFILVNMYRGFARSK